MYITIRRYRSYNCSALCKCAAEGRRSTLCSVSDYIIIYIYDIMHLNIIKFTYHSIAQRRGVAALNSVHGNRMAILAGDFLLSRASINLARLCSIEARARARPAQTFGFHKVLELQFL